MPRKSNRLFMQVIRRCLIKLDVDFIVISFVQTLILKIKKGYQLDLGYDSISDRFILFRLIVNDWYSIH